MELHELDQEVGAAIKRFFFEQRLLRPDIERGHLRDRIDQHLVVEARDCSPIDGQPQGISETTGLPLDFGSLDDGKRRRLAVVEGFDVDIEAAVKGVGVRLAEQSETAGSEEYDVEPSVIQLFDADDFADAPHAVERCLVIIVEPMRLDHGDLSCAIDGVADHVAVARLEDMQWKL